MGLTYNGGNVLLKYVYNNDDTLTDYDGFLIELQTSNGTPYDSGIGEELSRAGLNRNNIAWGITNTFVYNNLDIQFPVFNKDNVSSQTFTKFTLSMSILGGGSFTFATGTLNTPITVQKGETPIIRAYDSQTGDGITIDFDNFAGGKYEKTFTRKINDYIFLGQDSLSSVNQYRFIIINSSGQQTPLEFSLSRSNAGGGNWNVLQIAGNSATSYAQAQNKNDIVLPLNDGVNVSTNTIDFFYGEGDIGNNPTFTKAGRLSMTQLGNDTPASYQILGGETARLQAGELRINAK